MVKNGAHETGDRESTRLINNQLSHGWRNIFQSGGPQLHVKKSRKFMCFEWAIVTSQALKYDVIKFCQHV